MTEGRTGWERVEKERKNRRKTERKRHRKRHGKTEKGPAGTRQTDGTYKLRRKRIAFLVA